MVKRCAVWVRGSRCDAVGGELVEHFLHEAYGNASVGVSQMLLEQNMSIGITTVLILTCTVELSYYWLN